MTETSQTAAAPGVSAAEQPVAEPAGGPFSLPIYRRYWGSFVLASFGSQIQSVGAAWLMTSLTSSTIMIALVQASVIFPMMVFALVAGALADNFNRRLVMLGSQVIMASVSVVLLLLTLFGLMSSELLLLMTFVLGAGLALNSPSQAASVGDMVPRSTLPAAVALNSMGFNIARSAGPAVGGIIVATAGVIWSFGVNAMTYFVFIVFLLTWRPSYPEKHLPREGLGKAMVDGLRYVTMSPSMLIVMLRAAFFGFMASAGIALLPLIARDLVEGDAGAFGILSACFGIGATAGAFALARVGHRFPSEVAMRASAIALASGTLVASLSSSLWLTAIAMAFSGAGWMTGLSICTIIVQMSSPRWVVGRAMATFQTCAFGAMGIGAVFVGWLASAMGLAQALTLCAAVQFANILLGLVLRLRDMGPLDVEPMFKTYEPETVVPVTNRTGPVNVTIAYNIDAKDTPAFLDLMSERRRLMIRDGARSWRLLQDADDPERWVENYQTATWSDYIRQVTRRTQEDRSTWDQLNAMHRGELALKAKRMIERPTGAPGLEAIELGPSDRIRV